MMQFIHNGTNVFFFFQCLSADNQSYKIRKIWPFVFPGKLTCASLDFPIMFSAGAVYFHETVLVAHLNGRFCFMICSTES